MEDEDTFVQSLEETHWHN